MFQACLYACPWISVWICFFVHCVALTVLSYFILLTPINEPCSQYLFTVTTHDTVPETTSMFQLWNYLLNQFQVSPEVQKTLPFAYPQYTNKLSPMWIFTDMLLTCCSTWHKYIQSFLVLHLGSCFHRCIFCVIVTYLSNLITEIWEHSVIAATAANQEGYKQARAVVRLQITRHFIWK